MTLSREERDELAKQYVKKTKDTVEDVSFLIENNKLFLAINRIYYGLYYILSALAVSYQFSTSKHTQLIGWFNKNFVKENKIDIKYAKYIQEAFEKRSKGDYDLFVEFSEDDVKDIFKKMKETISEIEKLI